MSEHAFARLVSISIRETVAVNIQITVHSKEYDSSSQNMLFVRSLELLFLSFNSRKVRF